MVLGCGFIPRLRDYVVYICVHSCISDSVKFQPHMPLLLYGAAVAAAAAVGVQGAGDVWAARAVGAAGGGRLQ